MQLTLTFMSEKYSFQKDIMVNSRQSIGETIQILTEAGYFEHEKCQIMQPSSQHGPKLFSPNYLAKIIRFG